MHAVFLFDHSGVMADPWQAAGVTCWCVDIQHAPGVGIDGNLRRVGADLREPWVFPGDVTDVVFVAAFPPCTHLAVSGARWFRGKGLRALSESVAMFATAAEFCESTPAPYMIENPVSTISTYWRKPDYQFDPCQFTLFDPADNYTKKTCLWVGNGFTMPPRAVDHSLPAPDDRIHKAPPSAERGNLRSVTPRGFARAVFEANFQERKGRAA